MNVENIPTYLKEHASWCNFRYEERKGNMTKVPYNPATGYKAYVNKPEIFTDFETAVSALKDYDGLGIRVDGIIIAIDLDHCIKDGKLTTQAADIVSHFKNTYIERSPSGTGLRIILFVEDSYNHDKNNYYIKKGDIEVYVAGATNRFVTITGDVYLDNRITKNMEELKWLLDKYMKRKTPKNSSAELQENRESYLTDDGVLAKAMASKQGEKFRKLWNGDISDYPSNSEADLGFISILAFYCNGNREQVDRLYRQSALARSKWDEVHGNKTYGDMTIDAALSGMTTFYSPIVSAPVSEDFDDEMARLVSLHPEDIFKDTTLSIALIMTIIFIVLGVLIGPSNIKGLAGDVNWVIHLFLQAIKFTAGFVILMNGVRMFIGSLVPAFKGISDKFLPGAIPALDVPVFYPFIQMGAMFGFLGSIAGTVLFLILSFVVHFQVWVFPSPIIMFFDGCLMGVFANKRGGWKAAILAGLVGGFITHLGFVFLYPLTSTLYGSGITYSNLDYALIWLPLLLIIKFVGGLFGLAV